MVAALDFIRGHAADEIRVDDVARHAAQGRRMLEYKFRDLVGHTILEEIRRVRVQRVKQLLSDTDLSMPADRPAERFFHAPADVGRFSPG